MRGKEVPEVPGFLSPLTIRAVISYGISVCVPFFTSPSPRPSPVKGEGEGKETGAPSFPSPVRGEGGRGNGDL